MGVPSTSDIVFSLAGHDKAEAFIVTKCDGSFCHIVNGKTRKLRNPKLKSLKHIRIAKTGRKELAEAIRLGEVTDSVIRKELAIFRDEVGKTERGKSACQKMM